VNMSSANATRNFELVAGDPVLDLVNTLDWRFRLGEPEELLQRVGDFLRFCEQCGLLTARQARNLQRTTKGSAGERVLAACRELREAAAEIFYSALDGRSPATASLKTVDRMVKAARAHQRLGWNKSRLMWDWEETESSPEMPVWKLSLSSAGLMVSDVMQRVRACGNPECRWLFLDTSKNHTRRWCDMKICGNRMKARRFKALRRVEM